MLIYEDECVGCPPGMGCLEKSCPNLNVPHFCCDGCGNEYEEYYEYEEEYFCKDCFINIILESTNKYTREELIERGG